MSQVFENASHKWLQETRWFNLRQMSKNHHRSLHKKKVGETNTSLNPKAAPFQSQFQGPSATWNGNIQGNAVYQKNKFKPVTGLCPVQKVKVLAKNGNFVEVLAMLDSGSNTSLLSKNSARRLGLCGSATYLTMNLAGGKKKSKPSQIINITVASLTDEDISKTLQVYTVTRPCYKSQNSFWRASGTLHPSAERFR